MSRNVREEIETIIKSNKIVVFMKGTPQFPQCGFSATVVDILDDCGATYKGVNVLADFEVREGIKQYTSWPTIPQIFINGEFIGGCDVARELYASGELQAKLNAAVGES
ncbi:MAG: Grx4 family monothiol glutaredoxin [Myxococcales bacterium]|nr:Grx4 family monothiol glutaredoxin [Myxococcales bacterium]